MIRLRFWSLSVGVWLAGLAPLFSAAPAPQTTNASDLWGSEGEKWTPQSRLPGFSFAGYNAGEKPIPDMAAKADLRDFGALGDGVADATAAFHRAIASATNGAIAIPPKKLTSGELGHLNANGLPPMKFLREFRCKESATIGDKVTVEVFTVGERIDVIGTSNGKGFAGGVNRHHFAGGKKTHGQSDRHRAPGSRGSGTTPGRVLKGARSAGHMGTDRVITQALKIVMVDVERNLLGVHGAVAGGKGGLVLIKEARKQ